MNQAITHNLSQLRRTLLALTMGLIISPSLLAIGVSDIQLKSSLGQPLRATIALNNTNGLANEEIHINHASIEIYEKLGVDRSALYRTLLFEIDKNRVLNISSKGPIKEPFLHFIIQLRWPEGNLYREVKLLLDPPQQ